MRRGTFSNDIGEIYSGEIFVGQRHGHGNLKDKFGEMYQGQFKHNKIEGYGTY